MRPWWTPLRRARMVNPGLPIPGERDAGPGRAMSQLTVEYALRRVSLIAACSLLLSLVLSPLAWSQTRDSCPQPVADRAALDGAHLGGRPLSRPQLKWCMRQARSINAFLDRAAKRKLDLEQFRALIALKRRAGNTNAIDADAERRFRSALRASGLDGDALTATSEVLDTMETYDIACAGRPYDWRAELAVQRELRLSANPMHSVPFPATGHASETDDPLRSGRRVLSDEEQVVADSYHRYLIQQIIAQMKAADAPWSRGQVRIRLKVAPSGAVMSRSIVVSSGDRALDAAILAAIDRGHPYCPPPYIVAYSPSDILATISLIDTNQN